MSKPRRNADTPRLVVVEWEDAVCTGTWAAAVARQEPIKARSCGWLIHSDKKYVQVAATLAVDGEWNQAMTIPKGMVTSIKDVG